MYNDQEVVSAFVSFSLIPLLKMIQEVCRSDERLQPGMYVKYGSSFAEIQGKGTRWFEVSMGNELLKHCQNNCVYFFS